MFTRKHRIHNLKLSPEALAALVDGKIVIVETAECEPLPSGGEFAVGLDHMIEERDVCPCPSGMLVLMHPSERSILRAHPEIAEHIAHIETIPA